MLPRSNQPGQMHGTTKTHKLKKIEDIELEEMKFRQIIALTGTYTYNVTASAKHFYVIGMNNSLGTH